MRIKTAVSTAVKSAAMADIDAQAEAVRGHFITLGAGQAMVYGQKEKEAEQVTANPEINPAEVPHIAKEAAMAGISLLDQAAIVLSMAHNWTQLSAQIEEIRLGAKQKIGVARTPAEISAGVDEVRNLLSGFTSFRLA
ncbi:hypothetical protein EV128_12521 [Rhizobium azibense]|nr:hypothetical protein EV128_12521 [Rhizobium azibense]